VFGLVGLNLRNITSIAKFFILVVVQGTFWNLSCDSFQSSKIPTKFPEIVKYRFNDLCAMS
jgi:hypothetical protein